MAFLNNSEIKYLEEFEESLLQMVKNGKNRYYSLSDLPNSKEIDKQSRHKIAILLSYLASKEGILDEPLEVLYDLYEDEEERCVLVYLFTTLFSDSDNDTIVYLELNLSGFEEIPTEKEIRSSLYSGIRTRFSSDPEFSSWLLDKMENIKIEKSL